MTDADTTEPNARDENRPTAVVLLSGGMDSATTAYEAKSRGYDLYVLHTSYGQRTEDREYECARRLADELDAPISERWSVSMCRKSRAPRSSASRVAHSYSLDSVFWP